ncbi:MAG: hypothetical protein AAF085_00890 [Planctomycetota bacterium]
MQMLCYECSELAELPESLQERIVKAASAGFTSMPINCPKCGRQVLISTEKPDQSLDTIQAQEDYHCPVPGCEGWVVKVDEKMNDNFWGCGECGNVWQTKEELDQALGR